MRPEFLDFVLDQLAPLGPVRARRMFGGGGLYLSDTMFAIVSEDVLYFKVDDGNRAAFEDAGMGPFTYESRGRSVALSYYEVPPDLVEEPDALNDWARAAWEAARRSAAKGGGKEGGGKR